MFSFFMYVFCSLALNKMVSAQWNFRLLSSSMPHKSFMAIFLVKQQHVSNLLDNLYQSPNGKYNSYFQFVFNVVEFQNMISEKGQSSTIKVEWIIWICKCCLHLQRKLPLAKVSEWTVSALTKGNREGIVVPISEYKNPILLPLLS